MAELDRRRFLTQALGSLGVALGGASGVVDVLAQRGGAQTAAAAANPRRIDVHHHFAPPSWIKEVTGKPLLNAANTRWTAEASIADMDKGGCAAAIVSITNPGIYFGDAARTRALARECNDFGARLVQDHPTRFGMFATMPLPDVDACLQEIEYAYDTLRADGIGLLTSYEDVWLGHKRFLPVMEELNRRKAIVAVHPTAAVCCRNLDYGRAPGSIEYGTDTTRAIIGVALSPDAAKYPDIRWIWSHAGGSMPFLAGRIDGNGQDGFMTAAKKYYYDTAGAANKGAFASLLQLVSSTQIMFGTDFPPGGTSADVARDIRATGMFSEADLKNIDRENIIRLLPRFR